MSKQAQAHIERAKLLAHDIQLFLKERHSLNPHAAPTLPMALAYVLKSELQEHKPELRAEILEGVFQMALGERPADNVVVFPVIGEVR